MSIVNTTECIICYNEYDTEERKPCIGTCGHSICENCKHQMVSLKCPQCNREEAFAITTINYQVLELIKHFKSMSMPSSTKSVLNDPKFFNEGMCNDCSQHSRKLRLCITCAVKAGVLKHDKKKMEFVLNIKNDDTEAVLQRAKKITSCGDCLLDGIQHEGHKAMVFAVFQPKIDLVEGNSIENSFENRASRFQEAFNKLQESGDEVFPKLRRSLAANFELLRKKCNQWSHTPTIEQRNFLKTLEINIYEVLSILSSASKGLDISHLISPVSSVRKQGAHEPLLIGFFNPINNVWTQVGKMPNPKSKYAVASNKSQIFIIGGMNNGTWLHNVEMYDKDKKLRKNCNPMKYGRARASAGFHNSKMYVAGGYDSTYMSSVEVFAPDHGDWKDGPSLSKSRADGAVVSCDGKLFVLGGYNGNTCEETIEQLNELTQQFEIVGEMQGSRAGFAACEFRGRIYVAGGWNDSFDLLNTVRSYDPLSKTWRDEPSLNTNRRYFSLHATNESIYATRECTRSSNLVNEVERLDVLGQKWDLVSLNEKVTEGRKAD